MSTSPFLSSDVDYLAEKHRD